MNKHNAKDYLPFVQAMAEGKTIQNFIGSGWVDMHETCFVEPPDLYRVKPEPETRTVWINVYEDPERMSLWLSKQAADKWAARDRIACVPATFTFERK